MLLGMGVAGLAGCAAGTASNSARRTPVRIPARRRSDMQNAVCIKPLMSGQHGAKSCPGRPGESTASAFRLWATSRCRPISFRRSPRNHLDKFDASRLHAEIGLLADVLHTMDRMSTERLKSKSA